MTVTIAGRARPVAGLIGLLLAGSPLSVEAKGNCDAQGGLFYLGNTKNDARSMWLSATSSGSFRLEAAQGNTTVDQWSKTHRGLNITASPFVSNGNGGVHRLFDTSGNKDCLMDTQNQKGGIPIPPHIIIPTIRPNGYIPLPKIPTIHPTGYIPLPKIPTIHPTGYIPLPPVPTIHPTGYIPLPTVHPTGYIPLPTIHPTGYIPLPHPGPLPPRPPGPTPPGPTPPTPPGPGPMPGPIPPSPLPGPTPPAPTPVGPTPAPVGPVNPAGTITVAPGMPVDQRPPDDRQFLNCPDARTRATLPPGTRLPPECEDPQQQATAQPGSAQAAGTGATGAAAIGQVPITPGRDLGVGVSKPWNVWVDANFINSTDGRYGLDVSGWSRVGTVGMDRRITNNFVLGLFASLEDNATGGYGGFFSATTRGPTIGVYGALTLSPNWAIDGSLGYARLSNTMSLAVLDGSFLSQRLSASLNLHAQYDLDIFNVRPRLTGNYIKTISDAYDMQGTIVGNALSVTYGSSDYDYATIELAAEVNRVFTMRNGDRLMPYAEFGAIYEAVRPNGGQILSSDLLLVTPSPWSFQARAGVRMLLSDTVLLEARVGYLSFGQSGLDVVEGKLHASFSF